MNDIDSEIADGAAAIEAQRAELEPLALDLIAAGSAWASARWERITDQVIAANPELVKANIDRLFGAQGASAIATGRCRRDRSRPPCIVADPPVALGHRTGRTRRNPNLGL